MLRRVTEWLSLVAALKFLGGDNFNGRMRSFRPTGAFALPLVQEATAGAVELRCLDCFLTLCRKLLDTERCGSGRRRRGGLGLRQLLTHCCQFGAILCAPCQQFAQHLVRGLRLLLLLRGIVRRHLSQPFRPRSPPTRPSTQPPRN